MADREKVIKGLECCSNSQKNRCEANSCPYWVSECCCIDDMLNDALALIKEQEAVYPSWQNGKMYCGHCGSKFPPRVGMKFCHRCGMPIKLKVNDIVESEGR